MYNKPLKYIENLEVFNSLKISTGESDTSYTIGDSASVFGTPDIMWENVCFIESEKIIWTHGIFFNQYEFEPFTDEEILEMMPVDED